ncbi:hypothetical protein PENTCL1PPCAC_11677, partial [Pristionchus entomophagus]
EVQANGQCLSLAAPGTPCQVSQQCIDSSTCTNQRCTCSTFNAQVNNGYCIVPSPSCSSSQTRVNGQCVSYATPGAPCQANEQCVGGSTCLSSQCTCPMGRYSMNGYCLVDPVTGGNCNALTQVRGGG